MLKKLSLLMTLPVAAFAFDSGPIVRQNTLQLFTGPVDNIEFILAPQSMVQDKYNQTFNPYSVYPMNTWNGLTSNFKHNSYTDLHGDTFDKYSATVTVWAPRKNNSKVADWAKAQQTAVMNGYNKGKVYANVSGISSASAPEKLNFAFMGQIKIGNYVCDNVIIGQGHNSASRNDWWIYSNYWPKNADGTPKKSGYKNRIKCVSGDGEKQFRVLDAASLYPNAFALSPVND